MRSKFHNYFSPAVVAGIMAFTLFSKDVRDGLTSMVDNFDKPDLTEVKADHEKLKTMQASYREATKNTPAVEKLNHNPF